MQEQMTSFDNVLCSGGVDARETKPFTITFGASVATFKATTYRLAHRATSTASPTYTDLLDGGLSWSCIQCDINARGATTHLGAKLIRFSYFDFPRRAFVPSDSQK
jgi:hypothetical protein